ncbi:MAG: putative lipid II flippase FtsW [Luteitalea sp.]|nr:putative lipid II flippase FtsW [Luteitalea sp.]
MARKLKADKLLFLAVVVLVALSAVMVYSASTGAAIDQTGPSYQLMFRQLTWGVIGFFLLAITMRLDYRTWQSPAVIWTAVLVVAIALVAVLFGREINGTRRWFAVGGIGIQPSEFAKLAAILFTGDLLARRMERVNDVTGTLLPIGLVTGLFTILILLEPDFGTAITLLVIVGMMLFAAGLDYRYLFGVGLAALPALYMALISADYRRRRLFAFLDPWDDPLDSDFQLIQSLISVGTGGVTGRGFMEGVQKLSYVPFPHTDFIYAVIGEELGLIGASGVLLCFGVILWRGLRIAMSAQDRFGAFLAAGLTALVAAQAFVNMSVVLGLLPTKGIPLPFVSAGGSSLLVNLIGMGILLNVSQHASADG